MPEWLSNQGQQRRDEILRLALKEAQDRRRKRLVATTGAAFFGLLLIGGILFAVLPQRPASDSLPNPAPIAIGPSAVPATLSSEPPSTSPATIASPPLVVVERIQTDPQILEKLAVQPEAARWTSISDAELLEMLAADNQRAAIAVIGGEQVIVSY